MTKGLAEIAGNAYTYNIISLSFTYVNNSFMFKSCTYQSEPKKIVKIVNKSKLCQFSILTMDQAITILLDLFTTL